MNLIKPFTPYVMSLCFQVFSPWIQTLTIAIQVQKLPSCTFHRYRSCGTLVPTCWFDVSIQMKATEQYFLSALFIALYKEVASFESG